MRSDLQRLAFVRPDCGPGLVVGHHGSANKKMLASFGSGAEFGNTGSPLGISTLAGVWFRNRLISRAFRRPAPRSKQSASGEAALFAQALPLPKLRKMAALRSFNASSLPATFLGFRFGTLIADIPPMHTN